MRNTPVFGHSGIHGAMPGSWVSKYALDGAVGDWAKAPIGSEYLYKPSGLVAIRYRKAKDDNRTDDWVIENGVFSQRVARSQFTDGGAAIGHVVLAAILPIGVTVTQVSLTNVVGFTGDTSATIQIGDGTTVNRYSTGTPSVFTTAATIAAGAVSGTAFHAAAVTTVRATVTSAADFTNVAAGNVTITILFR